MRESVHLFRLTVFVAGLAIVPGSGASAGEELLVYSQAGPVPSTVETPGAVAEYAGVIDVEALLRSGRAAVGLTLPDGRRYQAVPKAIEHRGALSFLWRGELVGFGERASGIITVHRGHVAGLLTFPDRLYQVVPDPDGQEGTVRFLELDGELFPECAGAIEPPGGLVGSAPPTVRGGESIIDVMAVYTALAAQQAGGTPQIEAEIQAAVDITNEGYVNSNVAQRILLVHTEEVPYDESGQSAIAQLVWVRTDPAVAALRNEQGADMVALITGELPGFCGLAYVMNDPGPDFEDHAFSVTRRSCAVAARIFAHELGHNMGLNHDPANGPSPENASYPWSFGHNVPQQFRTIMSYACPIPCPKIDHFSNPDVEYNGLPTGIAEERDNARTLGLTDSIVEAFRPPAIQSPAFALAPDPLDFGEVPLGESSAPMELTLTGVGTEALTISAADVGAGIPEALPFVMVKGGSCEPFPVTLTRGESCTLRFVFGPCDIGPVTWTVVVWSNAPNSPHEVEILRGTGTEGPGPGCAPDGES